MFFNILFFISIFHLFNKYIYIVIDNVNENINIFNNYNIIGLICNYENNFDIIDINDLNSLEYNNNIYIINNYILCNHIYIIDKKLITI